MFKNTFQSGFISILYSVGSQPLKIWDKKVPYRLPHRCRKFTNYGLSAPFSLFVVKINL